MPKKYTLAQKRDWLHLSEEGRTDKWIAKEKAGGDARAVVRGINEARLFEEGKEARIGLLKDALLKHQRTLLGEVEALKRAVENPPAANYMPLAWEGKRKSVFSSEEEIEKALLEGLYPSESVEAALLKEHLKGDKLWKDLDEWRRRWKAALKARASLQLEAVELLTRETGVKTGPGDMGPEQLYLNNLGNLLLGSVFSEVLEREDGNEFENSLSADEGRGYVKYGSGSCLALVPGRERDTIKAILKSREKLLDAARESNLAGTDLLLKEQAEKVGKTLSHYTLLGIIPGRCSVCEKLGM